MKNVKGEVTHLTGAGNPWTAEDGTVFHKHTLTVKVDNEGELSGEVLSSKHPNPEDLPYKVGDRVEAEYHDGKYPKFKKVYKEGEAPPPYQGKRGGGGYKVNERDKYPSFAVSYAKDLVAAGVIKLEDIPTVAQSMYNTMVKLADGANQGD